MKTLEFLKPFYVDKVVTSDLIDSLQQDDKHFRTTLDNGFGSKAVTAALGENI